MNIEHGVNEMEDLKDLNMFESPCATRDRTQLGGGALSSDYVRKEVSKKLRNFSFVSEKACHCEDERSEDVAIAKSLNINEITTQSTIARNDNNREGTQNPLSSPARGEGFVFLNK